MIQQQIGDLLEIQYEGKYYYVVVLTKIVMFGGNIVFAFHTDGEKRSLPELVISRRGFNVASDLLMPKREGKVSRLHRFEDLSSFWLTKYSKASNEFRPGVKATEWFIYNIHELGGEHIARVQALSPEYRSAMDAGCFSFDLVAKMALRNYSPDQNEQL